MESFSLRSNTITRDTCKLPFSFIGLHKYRLAAQVNTLSHGTHRFSLSLACQLRAQYGTRESNAHSPDKYNCTFPAMVRDWRRKWSLGTSGHIEKEFLFGFVQVQNIMVDTFHISQTYCKGTFQWLIFSFYVFEDLYTLIGGHKRISLEFRMLMHACISVRIHCTLMYICITI